MFESFILILPTPALPANMIEGAKANGDLLINRNFAWSGPVDVRRNSGVCLAHGSSAYRSTAAEALMPHYTGLLASGYQNAFDMAQEADLVEKPYGGRLLRG